VRKGPLYPAFIVINYYKHNCTLEYVTIASCCFRSVTFRQNDPPVCRHIGCVCNTRYHFSREWLRRPLAGLSPRRDGLDIRPVQVRFLVNKVAFIQSFLRVLLFSPTSMLPPTFHSHIPFVCLRRHIIQATDSVDHSNTSQWYHLRWVFYTENTHINTHNERSLCCKDQSYLKLLLRLYMLVYNIAKTILLGKCHTHHVVTGSSYVPEIKHTTSFQRPMLMTFGETPLIQRIIRTP
jgi:hypothetical protein